MTNTIKGSGSHSYTVTLTRTWRVTETTEVRVEGAWSTKHAEDLIKKAAITPEPKWPDGVTATQLKKPSFGKFLKAEAPAEPEEPPVEEKKPSSKKSA